MIFEPRSLEKHEKIEFLVSLTISFMKILIFFLNSDFLPNKGSTFKNDASADGCFEGSLVC